MKIRFATPSDLEVVLDISRTLFMESRFKRYTFNAKKTAGAIDMMIRNPASSCVLLAERSGGEIAGMLAGYATEYFFCEGVVVQDRWFYVLPRYRGSSAAVKLLLAFRQWAEARKADELSINMSVGIDMERFNRLMTHMGFTCCGSNFSLPLGKV